MKIAMINEFSQAAKNDLILSVLKILSPVWVSFRSNVKRKCRNL